MKRFLSSPYIQWYLQQMVFWHFPGIFLNLHSGVYGTFLPLHISSEGYCMHGAINMGWDDVMTIMVKLIDLRYMYLKDASSDMHRVCSGNAMS